MPVNEPIVVEKLTEDDVRETLDPGSTVLGQSSRFYPGKVIALSSFSCAFLFQISTSYITFPKLERVSGSQELDSNLNSNREHFISRPIQSYTTLLLDWKRYRLSKRKAYAKKKRYIHARDGKSACVATSVEIKINYKSN